MFLDQIYVKLMDAGLDGDLLQATLSNSICILFWVFQIEIPMQEFVM